jgi:hypothetical protein
MVGRLFVDGAGTRIELYGLMHPVGLALVAFVLVALPTATVPSYAAISVLVGLVVVGRIAAHGEFGFLVDFLLDTLEVDELAEAQPLPQTGSPPDSRS